MQYFKKIFILICILNISAEVHSQVLNGNFKLPVAFGTANFVAFDSSTNLSSIFHSHGGGSEISTIDSSLNLKNSWEIYQVGNNKWVAFDENSSVYVAAVNYEYVTPWDFQVGSKIILFDKSNSTIIKTIPQVDLRYNSVILTSDTLIVLNSTAYNSDSLIHISKYDLQGNLITQKINNISNYGTDNFKAIRHNNTIFVISRKPVSDTVSQVFVTRLNLHGEILGQRSFLIAFNSNNGAKAIQEICINNNRLTILLTNKEVGILTGSPYYMFAIDTHGFKQWEMPLENYQGKNSLLYLKRNSDSTFVTYGFTGDVNKNYHLDKYQLNGIKLDSVNGSFDFDRLNFTLTGVHSLNFFNTPNGYALLVNYSTKRLAEYTGNYKLVRFNTNLEKLDSGLIRLYNFNSLNVASAQSLTNDTIFFIGSYTYKINSNTLSSVFACKFDFNSNYEYIFPTTGIDNAATMQSINIYPNPVNNNSPLTIVTDYPIISIKALNNIGQLVYQSESTANLNRQTITLNALTTEASYIIKIETTRGIYYRKIIIKN